MMLDRTTIMLSAARFTSAIARLALGPLLPILSVTLGFTEASKPGLLSAYSTGYLLTQIVGGYLADKYGYNIVISITVGLSALILFYISIATSAIAWTRAFFCLGFVAGPLFPAGSAAISSNVQPDRRAASFAIVDASASAGTTVASLSPIVAETLGWEAVYRGTGLGLVLVSLGISSQFSQQQQYPRHNSNIGKDRQISSPTNKSDVYMDKAQKNMKSGTFLSSLHAVLQPVAILTYLCHCTDNFTKYSVNSWTATMMVNVHDASPTMVGSILATQEAVGVISKFFVGTYFSSSFASQNGKATDPSLLFVKRGITSAIGFFLQGIALWFAFQAPTLNQAGLLLITSAIAVGSHSIGFRPTYLEISPEHAGSVSGFGNSVASCASIFGPVWIGTIFQQQDHQKQNIEQQDVWSLVSYRLVLVNLAGALAAASISLYSLSQLIREREGKFHQKTEQAGDHSSYKMP